MQRTLQPSTVTTIFVPSITATASETSLNPAPIIHAAKRNLVVVVRNNTLGAYVLLSFEVTALASFPNLSNVFKLPAGATQTFVVAKNQRLYVSTPGGLGGEVSVHYYEAFPVDDQPG